MKTIDGGPPAGKADSDASATKHLVARRGRQRRALVAQAENDLGGAVARALRPLVAADIGDLRSAIRAGRVRLLAVETIDGRSLPSNWCLPIESDEVVVALARFAEETRQGVAALVVARDALPRPRPDRDARQRTASALADAVVAEVLR